MSPKATAEAQRKRAIPEDDPAWQAAVNAPVDDTPETEEERAGVEAAQTGAWRDTAGADDVLADHPNRE
jgi:hypothetical protein